MSDPISKLINNIPSDKNRDELVSYLEELKSVSCLSFPTQNAAPQNIMTPLLKLGNFFVLLIKECDVIKDKKSKIFVSVISVVLPYVISYNDSRDEIADYKGMLDEHFIYKCKATYTMFKNCVTYTQGLPTQQNLDIQEKHLNLARLASDCPINTGVDVLAYLGAQISELSKGDGFDNFTRLMKKTTLYCWLSVCRELFLLSRYAIEICYGRECNSVKHVIESERHDAENLLRFLYKPKRSMAINFLNYIKEKKAWHVVTEFLQRRIIVEPTSFAGRTVKIWSAYYDNACLSYHDLILMSCIRCHNRTPGLEGTNTSFLFLPRSHDKYVVMPRNKPGNFVYFGNWVRYSSDMPTVICNWRLVELEADESGETLFMLLNGDRLDGRCAIYTDLFGNVYLESPSKTNLGCFWKLQIEE